MVKTPCWQVHMHSCWFIGSVPHLKLILFCCQSDILVVHAVWDVLVCVFQRVGCSVCTLVPGAGVWLDAGAGTRVVRELGKAVGLLRPDAPASIPAGSGKSEFLLLWIRMRAYSGVQTSETTFKPGNNQFSFWSSCLRTVLPSLCRRWELNTLSTGRNSSWPCRHWAQRKMTTRAN